MALTAWNSATTRPRRRSCSRSSRPRTSRTPRSSSSVLATQFRPMHFIRAGDGSPALVFVHGFACSHQDWRAQVEHFQRSHEVLACDLRGHGRTPGRPHECSIEHYGGDVAALVNNLEIARTALVGHSMGCRVVLEAARLIPDRVAGIVLVDGSRNAASDPEGAEAVARATIEKLGYARFAEALFRQMFFKPSAEADSIVERAVRSSAEFGPHLWPRITRWDAGQMADAFAALRAPVLAIQSTTRNAQLQRAPLKPGDSSAWIDYLRQRGARVEIVPDTGHFTQLEAPDAVNRLIGEFLRELKP
ncbi:MAG: alpha/beta hydrolase [Betaproteobacteria bacterium]|nr:MAG: alpha/beta hydrolase [Betaproteobacteria bacterium]